MPCEERLTNNPHCAFDGIIVYFQKQIIQSNAAEKRRLGK
jgi:hypothetical protein